LFQSWAEGRYPKEVAEAVCDRPLLALAGSNDSVLAAALDREEHQECEADRFGLSPTVLFARLAQFHLGTSQLFLVCPKLPYTSLGR
jgi:hypothetical protein